MKWIYIFIAIIQIKYFIKHHIKLLELNNDNESIDKLYITKTFM